MPNFKVYCTIKPAHLNDDNKLFNLLVERLNTNISDLSEKGYWFEPCKVEINYETSEISFGYPYVFVEKIFSETFHSSIRLNPNNAGSTYEIGTLIQNARRERFCKQEPLTFQIPYQFQLDSRLTDARLLEKIKKLDEIYKTAEKHDWPEIKYQPEEDHLSSKTLGAIFHSPLNKKVLVIGEKDHVKGRYLAFLCENIELLKDIGIRILAVEGFFYKFHQKALDQYYDSAQEELPIELKQCAIEGYIEPLKQFKKAGIRIVGLDNLASAYAAYYDSFSTRLSTFNIYAANVIKKEIKNAELCIAFVGLAHAVNEHHATVGLPCLIPETICLGLDLPNNNESKKIVSNYSFWHNGNTLKTHLFDRPLLKSEQKSSQEISF